MIPRRIAALNSPFEAFSILIFGFHFLTTGIAREGNRNNEALDLPGGYQTKPIDASNRIPFADYSFPTQTTPNCDLRRN
jgi:hypothetical protein